MKSDTQIMNELAISSGILKPITEEESIALKGLLLQMLGDFVRVCNHNGLDYMLGGGSCLGSVRHGGFIPWDDDLDIMMPRPSYEKLISLLRDGCLGECYEYDTPNQKSDCRNTYLKIFRKGTFDVEITNENAPGPKGVFIDVFPIDSAPKNAFFRTIKGCASDLLQAICSCVLYYQYPSSKYLSFMSQSKEGRNRYRIRLFFGRFLGIVPHQKWVWWFDRLNAHYSDTGVLTVPTGRKHYKGECLPKGVLLPPSEGTFEGMSVSLPNDVHSYLSSLYGDYMSIPPEDKRERHFVYLFYIGK